MHPMISKLVEAHAVIQGSKQNIGNIVLAQFQPPPPIPPVDHGQISPPLPISDGIHPVYADTLELTGDPELALAALAQTFGMSDEQLAEIRHLEAEGLDRALLQFSDKDVVFTQEEAIEYVLVKNGLMDVDSSGPIPPHIKDALLANPSLIPIISAAGVGNPGGDLKISQEDALHVILNPDEYPPSAVALSRVILEHEYQSDNPFLTDRFGNAPDGGFKIPIPDAQNPSRFTAFRLLFGQDTTSGAFYNPVTQNFEVVDDAFSVFQQDTVGEMQRPGAELQASVPSGVELNPEVNYTIVGNYETGSDVINVVAVADDGNHVEWTVAASTEGTTGPVITPDDTAVDDGFPQPEPAPGPIPEVPNPDQPIIIEAPEVPEPERIVPPEPTPEPIEMEVTGDDPPAPIVSGPEPEPAPGPDAG